MKSNWNRAEIFAFVLFGVAVAVVLRWLWSGVFLAEFNSDTADTLFWAAASRDAGSIASPTFHYNYFIPFGDRLLLRPLLSVFGMDVAAIRVSMTVFLLIFLASALALFRSFRWSRTACLHSVALILTVASATTKMREVYLGHVVHYGLGTLFLFFGIASAPDPLLKDEKSSRTRILHGLVFSICMAWTASCGKPLLLYAVIPVLGAWILVRSGHPRPFSIERDGAKLLPGIAGATLGFALFVFLSRNLLPIEYGASYEVFSPVAHWWDNVSRLPGCWISLVASLPCEAIPIAGGAGLPVAGEIALAVLLALAPVVALFRIRSFSPRERMLVTAHWILSAGILFYWIFGTVSDANWRLGPIVLSSAVVTACLVRNALGDKEPFERRAAFWTIGLVFSICVLIQLQTAFLRSNRDIWRDPETLIPVLETIGVRNGYCTDYWFSNVTTVLSEDRFRLREVEPDENGEWRGRPYLTDDRWFEPDPERTRTVFVCYPKEVPLAPREGLVSRAECFQIDTRNDHYARLVVLVYDGDCLAKKGE